MVDKSRSRSKNGAGLGLALCVEILRLHGSELQIESKVGEGTCMSFLIPDRQPGPEGMAQKEPMQAKAGRDGAKQGSPEPELRESVDEDAGNEDEEKKLGET